MHSRYLLRVARKAEKSTQRPQARQVEPTPRLHYLAKCICCREDNRGCDLSDSMTVEWRVRRRRQEEQPLNKYDFQIMCYQPLEVNLISVCLIARCDRNVT